MKPQFVKMTPSMKTMRSAFPDVFLKNEQMTQLTKLSKPFSSVVCSPGMIYRSGGDRLVSEVADWGSFCSFNDNRGYSHRFKDIFSTLL